MGDLSVLIGRLIENPLCQILALVQFRIRQSQSSSNFQHSFCLSTSAECPRNIFGIANNSNEIPHSGFYPLLRSRIFARYRLNLASPGKCIPGLNESRLPHEGQQRSSRYLHLRKKCLHVMIMARSWTWIIANSDEKSDSYCHRDANCKIWGTLAHLSRKVLPLFSFDGVIAVQCHRIVTLSCVVWRARSG